MSQKEFVDIAVPHKQTYGEATWPDPVSHPFTPPQVDDMSRLNATQVARVWEVRTTEDILSVLRRATDEGRQVSIRGAQHSMGGHTITPDGHVIDMRHFDSLRYDPEQDLVTAGSGAHWSDLIRYLNSFGKSPRTMQSYSTFSVGGTVGVNAHGITSDYSLSESVVSFVMVTADLEVITCSRQATMERPRELFSLAIGGYGLFGIITEVTLKVVPNTHLELDLLHVTPKEFARVYPALITADADNDGDVDIKMARLDITNLEHIELYVFRRASNVNTVSSLDLKPRQMSLGSRLMYKWLAPTLKEVRFFIERTLGTAFDWSQTNERNVLMYESAVPLARLYSPLIQIDDTFILQEYFVPQSNFMRWIELTKPIYSRIAKQQQVHLLNTTIRFVKHDKDTFLSYAREPAGVYAFVLYFRIRRTSEADEALQAFHRQLADATLLVHGTFYLPYRHHYTSAQLEQAYGIDRLKEFMALKQKHDPKCLFSNLWLRAYGATYASESYQSLISRVNPQIKSLVVQHKANAGFEVPEVSVRRTDSYRRLFLNPILRRRFLEEFLVYVFNIEDPSVLFKIISKAVWDPENKSDLDVYCHIQMALSKDGSGVLKTMWNQLKQLRQQKDELAQATLSIISRLGKVGQLHDYVSIGDNGKLVISLRDALDMRGQVWVVHDSQPNSSDLIVVLERGSVEPLGDFVPIDYSNVTTPQWGIPDESADLVTMNQGLHHIPREEVMKFLSQVFRILRPGGLFIIREHDAKPADSVKGTNEVDLIPMLDIAHSVFNVVTGVPFNEERAELRAFRSVLQWREIVEAAGFIDSMLYAKQPTDPTVDVMMCFCKPGELAAKKLTVDILATPPMPPLVPVLSNILEQVPAAALDMLRGSIEGIISNLPSIMQLLTQFVTTTSSAGTSSIVSKVIERFTTDAVGWLERFRPFLESSVSGGANTLSFIPPEILLIVPAINKKVALGTASAMELVVAALIHDVQALFSMNETTAPKLPTEAPPKPHGVPMQEVQRKFTALAATLPMLCDVDTLFRSLEIPALAQRAIRSFWAASRPPGSSTQSASDVVKDIIATFSEWLVPYLDTRAWTGLSTTIDEIIKQKAVPPSLQSIIDTATTPKGIIGSDSLSLWARALVAVLGSRRVYFNRMVVLQLRLVGIVGLEKALSFAQKLRSREGDNTEDDESSKPLLKALEPLSTLANTEVVMQQGYFFDIHNVQEVVSAKYGYSSLTTSPVDVLDIISKRLSSGTLLLASLPVHELQKKRESVPGLDMLRRAVTMNVSELTITYKPAIETDPGYQRKVDELLSQMTESGWVKPLHHKDGHFTWFKLPEWMQVEMVQVFGDSMTHTPWYRFPFMRFIQLYFQVLMKEVGIVQTKHGIAKALFSNAFLTDLVPGLAMFFIFLQLQLLALPVKSVGGAEYSAELMVEEVVVLTSATNIKWRTIDDRINAQQVVPDKGLFVLTIPTFKPFTEILLKIARSLPQSQVLEISNQRTVQAKVVLPYGTTQEAEASLQAKLSKLSAINGCAVMFNYRYPIDGSSATNQPRLAVSIISDLQMSWQQCVDEQLIANGYLCGGAILGHNGIVWASTNIILQQEEISRLLAGFADSVMVMKSDVYVNGSQYTPVKANSKAIYVGVYKKTGKAVVVVEKLGEYLRERGF